jgi:ABC-type transport system involved in multi-copper enzyme maturation permease subunit
MSPLLRSELLKLRTTRTFAALVGAALALSLLVVILTTAIGNDFTPEDLRQVYTSDASGLFIFLLGIMGMAGEWRHRTITATALASPNRTKLVASKLIAYALAGAVLSLVVSVAIMVAGSAILSSRDITTLSVGDLADVLWRNLTVAALSGALGVCIGGIVRNQVVAIVGILLFGLIAEPTLVSLAPEVGKFGFTSGAPNAILDVGSIDGGETLSLGAALLVMFGWLALGFAAAATLLRRRDLV